jgi:hypothetical protein
VSGAAVHLRKYTVKLEGSRRVGYKTVFIGQEVFVLVGGIAICQLTLWSSVAGGVRDPVLIGRLDEFLAAVYEYTADMFPVLRSDPEGHKIIWHQYGKNAVMEHLEPEETAGGGGIHEVGVYCDVIAPTQELANAIANNARVSCLHMPYEGQVATGGNFAFPGTPVRRYPLSPNIFLLS